MILTEDSILFNNQRYPYKEIAIFGHPDFEGQRFLVSTLSLAKVLLDEHSVPINKEAQFVDEHIFYYVSDEEIFLSDEDLSATISRNL